MVAKSLSRQNIYQHAISKRTNKDHSKVFIREKEREKGEGGRRRERGGKHEREKDERRSENGAGMEGYFFTAWMET